MKAGVVLPQGWVLEYRDRDPVEAWAQTVAVARQAETLGFESVWLYDHFHTWPSPEDAIVFEPFVALSALAASTERVRVGHIVICTGFRNPALTAKMIATLDVVSGGRAELGIGAGWKQEEWEAYGYDYPTTRERLAMLGDHLEIITRMLDSSTTERARFEGQWARVDGAINQPKPLQQPRVPVMVGGNGPNVTWRLAARYADELNLDGMDPGAVASALPVIRARCEEIGRDPDTLRISVHTWWSDPAVSDAGRPRQELFAAYADLGLARVQTYVDGLADGPEALAALAEDLVLAGVEFEEA
jgi:F420-dependent oxidoreductase-like protein